MYRMRLSRLATWRDLVDEAIVERLSRVEITSAPHVLGNLLGGLAGAPGQASVELPEELLLLAALRGDLLRGAGEPRRRLGKVEPRMRRGGAVIGGRDHADNRAADLTPAKDAQRRAQHLGGVDQDEGRPKCPVGAVQVEIDGSLTAGVQRQERGRRPRRCPIVEVTRDEHDAALEELLLQPAPEAHAPSV